MAVHRLSRGLDLPLAGAPRHVVEPAAAPARVALVAPDYIGLKPTMLARVGDRVLRGTPLFEDKAVPGVRHVAPAAGVVKEINRGEQRALQSVVIERDGDDSSARQVRFASFSGRDPDTLDGAGVRALLVEAGLWSALRARPFSRVPAPASEPHSIFVTAIDTRPHAPPVDVALAGRELDFERGVAVVSKLCEGTTYVCKAEGSRVQAPALPNVTTETFSGPHPAGTPGVHIHRLDAVHLGKSVWHIGYQDVVAIGRLFATGTLDVERVIALAGPGVARPRLLRVALGAALADLTRGELHDGEQRVISGSVLDGRAPPTPELAYLGRYHLQVSALPEGRERAFMGWIAPGKDRFSLWRVVLGHWSRALALTTSANGSKRAMVPIGAYERVMPQDILPTFLLRALITGDDERAENLGCLELDEEDVALCSFVCPGKLDYAPLLRAALTRIEKAGV